MATETQAPTAKNAKANGSPSKKSRTPRDLKTDPFKAAKAHLLSWMQKFNPDEYNLKIQPKLSESTHKVPQAFIASRQMYDLLDEMGSRHPISSALKKIVAVTVNKPEGFRWDDPDEADHPQAEEIMLACDKYLLRMNARFGWSAFRRNAVKTIIKHGFSVHRIDWTTAEFKAPMPKEPKEPEKPEESEDPKAEGPEGEPEIEPKEAPEPEPIRTTIKTILVPAGFYHEHPGRFCFREGDGQLQLLTNYVDGQDTPPMRFILAGSPSEYGNPFGRSIVYELRFEYALRQSALASWIRFTDKYGFPILTMKQVPLPQGSLATADYDAFNTWAEKFDDMVASLAEDDAISVPLGYDVASVSRSAGQHTSPHQEIVKYHDTIITIALLGAVLQSMEAEHGSRAQAGEHTKSEGESIQFFQHDLVDAINRDVVEPFVRLNWGNDAPVPEYFIEALEPKDFANLRENLKVAKEIKLDVREEEVYEALGLSMPEESDSVYEWKSEPSGLLPFDPTAGGLIPGGEEPEENEPPEPEEPEEPEEKLKPPAPVKKNSKLTDKTRARKFSDAKARQLEAEKLNRRVERIAILIASFHRDLMVLSFEEAIDKLIRDLGGGSLIPSNGVAVSGFNGIIHEEQLVKGAKNAMMATRASAYLAIYKTVKSSLPVEIVNGAKKSPIPAAFQSAADWMASRKVMTTPELKEMARALTVFNAEAVAPQLEQAIREQVFSIARAADRQAIQDVQKALAEGIKNGETLTEFKLRTDAMVKAGKLPGATDAYLENVYRTETANALAAQREALHNDPLIADEIVAFELYNPNDEASRETHAAIDGIIVLKNSPAELASRPGPPWSYQCRCDKLAIIAGDPDAEGIQESPDAMEKILAIERFS